MNISAISPQNFSIPAGYNEIITFDVNPAITPSLEGTNIFWRVYSQWQGIPNRDDIILAKSTADDIVPMDSPNLAFTVQMHTADTIALLRNFYHEASIQNGAGEK
jgi:hypothetical protein